MRRQLNLSVAISATIMGGLILSFISPATALAQSDIVLMTADAFDPVPESNVYRFDFGMLSQTFNTGPSAAYQGIARHFFNQYLVADYGADAIQIYYDTGDYVGSFTNVTDPTFVETDSSHNIYVTSGLGSMAATRLDAGGFVSQTFTHPDLDGYRGIDADSDGNVYIANSAGPGTQSLFKFAPDGTFISNTSLGSINPYDISIDETGERLIMADQDSTHGVKIFDISGPVPTLVDSILTLGSSIVGVYYAPESGNILAAELAHALIEVPSGYEFSPDGDTLLATYTLAGAALGWDIVTAPQIPEPASAALMLVAVGACGFRRRLD